MTLPRFIQICLAVLLALGASECIAKQSPEREGFWRHDFWGPADGLPDNSAERLLQTRDGWLWIGTRAGLARFDGHTFIVYDGHTPGFTSDAIQDLEQDKAGDIWIATKHGLYRKKGSAFKRFGVPDGLLSESVHDLVAAPDGGVWIATQKGLNRYFGGKISGFPRSPADVESKLDVEVAVGALGLAVAGDSSVWVGGSSGLHHFDLSAGWKLDLPLKTLESAEEDLARRRIPFVDSKRQVFVSGDYQVFKYNSGGKEAYPFPIEPGDVRVRKVVEAGDGTLWLVRAGQLYQLKQEGLVSFRVPFALADAYITDLIPGPGNDLWIGTRHAGLHRIRPRPMNVITTANGLPHKTVSSVAPARSGGVWVGTQRGIRKVEADVVRPLKADFSETDYPVSSLFEDSKTNLWIGTGHGWPGLDRVWNTIVLLGSDEGFKSVSAWPAALSSVWFEDSTGHIWSASDGALVCFEPNSPVGKAVDPTGRELDTGHVAKRRELVGGWQYKKNSVLRYQGKTEILMSYPWKGTSKEGASGEMAYDWRGRAIPGEILEKSPLPIDVPLASYDITSITETKDGSLWIATWGGGLHRIKHRKITLCGSDDGLVDGRIHTLAAFPDGSLWVGTAGGLCRVSASDLKNSAIGPPRFKSLDLTSGLPSKAVHQIETDGTGVVWIGSERGIYRIEEKILLSRFEARGEELIDHLLFDSNDGLFAGSTVSRVQPGSCRSSNGLLWFASSSGLVCINPKLAISKTASARIHFESVTARGVKFPIYDAAKAEEKPLVLPPGSGHSIEFRFTALTDDFPELLRFRYRLEGHDSEWVEAGTRRSAFYTKLNPGNHRFEVQVSEREGRWSGNPGTLLMYIQPTLWQQNAFKIGAGAGVLALAGLAWVLHVHLKLKRRAQLEEALTEERQRISQELHDHLGSDITRMSWLCSKLGSDSEAGLKLEELARQLAAALLGITSVLRHRNESLEQMVESICQYAEQFLQGAGLELELDVPTEMPARAVSATLHQAVYLSVRESLLNVHKHARATKVVIKIVLDESRDEVTLTISDNGVGLAPRAKDPTAEAGAESSTNTVPPSGGAGLVGMKKRMEQVGGSFSCRFGRTTGTVVQLIFPTPRTPKEFKNQSKS